MTWWEILGVSLVYASGSAICARVVTGHFAYTFAEDADYRHYREKGTPETAQWFGALCIGLLVGLIWPVALMVGLWGNRLVVGSESAHLRRRQAERIADLEREAGIR